MLDYFMFASCGVLLEHPQRLHRLRREDKSARVSRRGDIKPS